MNYGRKNTFLNEHADEQKVAEEQRKKAEYLKLLKDQMEEAERKKKQDKEAKRKKELEELAVESQQSNQPRQKFKTFAVVPANPFQEAPVQTAKVLNDPLPVGTVQEKETTSTESKPSAQPVPQAEIQVDKQQVERASNSVSRSKITDQRAVLVQFRDQLDDYLNRQIDSLNSLSNSTQNCINTSLSKQYVMLHKNTNDYTTIADFQSGNNFLNVKDYNRNSNTPLRKELFEAAKETELLNELAELKKTAILLTNEFDERKMELAKLQSEFKRIQKTEHDKSTEIAAALRSKMSEKEEQSLIYSYLAMQNSRQLSATSDWVSFIGKDYAQTGKGLADRLRAADKENLQNGMAIGPF